MRSNNINIFIVLCGMTKNEFSDGAGGIQLAELSFAKVVTKNNVKLNCTVYGLSDKNELEKVSPNLHFSHIKGDDSIKQGGIIDSWVFSHQISALLASKSMLNDNTVIHFSSLGPAITFLSDEFVYYRDMLKIKPLISYSLHNIHYSLSDKPYDIFKKYKKEWIYLSKEEKRIINIADIIFVSSHIIAKELSAKYTKKKIIYLPNTVGILNEYNVLEKDSHYNKFKIFFSMCRFDPVKNLTMAAESFAGLSNENKNIRWIIAGDGIEKDTLIIILNNYGIKFCRRTDNQTVKGFLQRNIHESTVLFTGPVSGKDKDYIMNIGNILLQPSLREVSPLIGYEALVYGKIIIGSNIPGWVDFKNHGADIYLPKSNSTESIGLCMENAIKIVGTKKQRSIFLKNRSIYKKSFDAKMISKKRLTEYYKSLYEKHKKQK